MKEFLQWVRNVILYQVQVVQFKYFTSPYGLHSSGAMTMINDFADIPEDQYCSGIVQIIVWPPRTIEAEVAAHVSIPK